jgi:hypothetical protein
MAPKRKYLPPIARRLPRRIPVGERLSMDAFGAYYVVIADDNMRPDRHRIRWDGRDYWIAREVEAAERPVFDDEGRRNLDQP